VTDIERDLRELHREARGLEMSDADVARVMARRDATPRRRRPRARWLLALVPVAAVVAGATWAATRPSTEALATTGVACVSSADAAPDATAVVRPDGRDPVDVCAGLWRRGEIDRSTHEVPPLTACAGGAGNRSVVVFPTGDAGVCDRLGGRPLPADYAGVSERLAGLRAVAEATACRSAAQARAAVAAELARIGADDWRVTTRRVPDPAPCVAVTIDGDRRTVAVLELARPPAPSPAAAARHRAWSATFAAVERANPGWPERGCPDPAATLGIVRRSVAGTVLARTPVVVSAGADVPGVGFNRVLRCADVALALSSGDGADAILLVPEVPRGAVYPTDDELRRLARGPNDTLGLPGPP